MRAAKEIRRRLALGAVAVTVLVPAPAVAGDEIREPGEVTIDHNARRDRFKVVVRAKEFEGYSEPGCRKLRQVVVKRRQPGRDKVVNRDLTNKRGRYYLPNLLKREKFHRGRFYAKLVEKRLTDRQGPDVVCEQARSKILRVR